MSTPTILTPANSVTLTAAEMDQYTTPVVELDFNDQATLFRLAADTTASELVQKTAGRLAMLLASIESDLAEYAKTAEWLAREATRGAERAREASKDRRHLSGLEMALGGSLVQTAVTIAARIQANRQTADAMIQVLQIATKPGNWK